MAHNSTAKHTYCARKAVIKNATLLLWIITSQLQNPAGTLSQHDNGRPHAARATVASSTDNNAEVVTWSAFSPDLVACSASDIQGLIFESYVWRAVSPHSSHHPQEVLVAQFSLYVHKSGLKPDSFYLFLPRPESHRAPMGSPLVTLPQLRTAVQEKWESFPQQCIYAQGGHTTYWPFLWNWNCRFPNTCFNYSVTRSLLLIVFSCTVTAHLYCYFKTDTKFSNIY